MEVDDADFTDEGGGSRVTAANDQQTEMLVASTISAGAAQTQAQQGAAAMDVSSDFSFSSAGGDALNLCMNVSNSNSSGIGASHSSEPSSEEPLDMSVGSIRVSTTTTHPGSSGDVLQESYRVPEEQYSEQLQLQQQAMRDFFPDVQQPRQQSLSQSEPLGYDNPFQLRAHSVASVSSSSSSSSPLQFAPQAAHQATLHTSVTFQQQQVPLQSPNIAHQAQQALSQPPHLVHQTQQAQPSNILHPAQQPPLQPPSVAHQGRQAPLQPPNRAYHAQPAAQQSLNIAHHSHYDPQHHQQQLQRASSHYVEEELVSMQNQYNNSHSSSSSEPLAKVGRSSVGLLHPSLRKLSPQDLAMALLKQDRREVALNLKQECIEKLATDPKAVIASKTLWCLLELLLNVNHRISSTHTIDWMRHLAAGGEKPEDFLETVAVYDTRTSCGIVWTANFLAHRCNTCCISPCMSLCSSCFNSGDHRGHDYNLFRSQSGGACDCGNASVLKPKGFCKRHNPDYKPRSGAPPHLFLMLQQIIPHIVARLVYHLRETSHDTLPADDHEPVSAADGLLSYCQELCERNLNVEVLFREVLCSKQAYEDYNQGLICEGRECNSSDLMRQSVRWYRDALDSLPDTNIPHDFPKVRKVFCDVQHHTFLEELVFWMVKYEFPEKLSCFLLSMRPDSIYEDAFTRAFVCHYGKLHQMLHNCQEFATISPRVVHVSVQLFSDLKLALRMVQDYPLLDVLVICLGQITEEVLIDGPAHGLKPLIRPCKVVDIFHPLLVRHCFWPFLSDLNNLLSHKPIAYQLISNDWLRHQFLTFVASFQFMNIIDRIPDPAGGTGKEATAYVTAYGCELETTAISVWSLVVHLCDPEDEQCVQLMMVLVSSATCLLVDWFNRVGFQGLDVMPTCVSFHLPIHRLLMLYLSHATRVLHIPPARLEQSFSVLSLALTHPLKAMLLFHETMVGLFKSPVFEVVNQVTTYTQTTMGHMLMSSDLYLMQMVAAHHRPDALLGATMHQFDVPELLSLASIPDDARPPSVHRGTTESLINQRATRNNQPVSDESLRLEIFLIQMCFVAAIRTHWERDIGMLVKREMATALCIADRTHSGLIDLMPEKLINVSGKKISLKKYAKKLTIALKPRVTSNGECLHGQYRPKNRVWKRYYDPLHVLLRSPCRKLVLDAERRYRNYLRSLNKLSGSFELDSRLWPPFIIPEPLPPDLSDPRRVLMSHTLHAVFFAYLYKAVYQEQFNTNLLPYLIYLMEMTVEFHVVQKDGQGGDLLADTLDGECSTRERVRTDQQLSTWFTSDHIFSNATTVIPAVTRDGIPDFYMPSDEEMDFSEPCVDAAEIEASSPAQLSLLPPSSSSSSNRPLLSLPLGSEMVPYRPDPLTTPETPLTPLTITPMEGEGSRGHHHPLALPPPPRAEDQAAGEAAGAAGAEGQASEGSDAETLVLIPTAEQAGADEAAGAVAVRGHHDGGNLFAVPANPAPPLPAPPQYPTLLAGTEVGRPGAAPAPSSSSQHRHRRPTGPHNPALPPPPAAPQKVINESIISLLIKLYSKVTADGQYRPNFDEISTSRIGDAGHFISLLLNKMGHHDSATRDHINNILAQAAAESAAANEGAAGKARRDGEEAVRKAKEERARKSALRQQKVMEAFKKQQKLFSMENKEELENINMNEGEHSSSSHQSVGGATAANQPAAEPGQGGSVATADEDWGEASEKKEEEEYEDNGFRMDEELKSRMHCCICSQEKSEPLGLNLFLMPSSSGSQSRLLFTEEQSFPVTERGLATLKAKSKNNLICCAKERYQAALAANYHTSWQLWENRGFDFSAIGGSCGHFVHLSCQLHYYDQLPKVETSIYSDAMPLDIKHGDFYCTVCRLLANTTIPLTPFMNHWIKTGSIPHQAAPPPQHVTQPPPPTTLQQPQYPPKQDQAPDITEELQQRTPGTVPPFSYHSQNNLNISTGVDLEDASSNLLPPTSLLPREVGPTVGVRGLSSTTTSSGNNISSEALEVYHMLQKHDFQEYTGLLKECMVLTYKRITGMPLSRLRHTLDDAYNTCKLGYLNSCLRSSLEAQLINSDGLVSREPAPVTVGWDSSRMVSVSMFHILSYSSRALSHEVLYSSSIRHWVSDRWGQVSLDPLVAGLPTYGLDAMTCTTPARVVEKFRRSQRYSQQKQYDEVSGAEDVELLEEQEVDDLTRRYHNKPVLPLLACDPVAVLLQFWLMLPPNVHTGIIDCIIVNSYRLVIVQATISALRDLNTKELREKVVQSSSRLSPLLALVYESVREYDSRVFYKHPTELQHEALFKQPEDHDKDEVLIEMRLHDITDVKKLKKEEQQRIASLRNEDMTDSEDSDSDESERSEDADASQEGSDHTQQEQQQQQRRYSLPSTPLEQVERHITGLCLDYLRVAALLRHQLYNIPLPAIATAEEECGLLEQYLGVSSHYSVVDQDTIRSMCEDRSTTRAPHSLISHSLAAWCPPLLAMASTHWDASSVLLRRQLFRAPTLLQLPKIYEFFFKFYNDLPCEKCGYKVDQAMVCLLCGAVVCFKILPVRGKYHYTQHAASCGGTQGIFIAINQTCTVLVRGARVLKWGSLYLDMNGEEDRDIRRGRTLRLNKERMEHLLRSYITNNIEHIHGRWRYPIALRIK